MTKTLKRIILGLLTAALVICLCAGLCACFEPKADGFVVTVVYPDGRAVNGQKDGAGNGGKVLASLCGADGSYNYCDEPVEVGADGKVTLKPSADLENCTKFRIKLSSLPSGYSMSEGADGLEVTAFGFFTMTLKANVQPSGDRHFVKVVDGSGAGISGVYVMARKVQTVSPNAMSDVAGASGVTDSSGVADIYFDELEGYSYFACFGGENAPSRFYPYGYKEKDYSVEERDQLFIAKETYFNAADGQSQATLSLLSSNELNDNEQLLIPYSRAWVKTNPADDSLSGGKAVQGNRVALNSDGTFNAEKSDNTDFYGSYTYRAFTTQLKAGKIGYFYFTPYLSPADIPDSPLGAVAEQRRSNALRAAVGTYKITLSASAGSLNIVRFMYSPVIQPDEKGYPPKDDSLAAPVGDVITIDNNSDVGNAPHYFYVLPTADCTLSITVERTGDSYFRTTEYISVASTLPANAQKAADNPDPNAYELCDVLLSDTVVLGADNFYHYGKADGPIIYAYLTSLNGNIADIPIFNPEKTGTSQLPEDFSGFASRYIQDNINYRDKVYDYSGALASYAALVNKDGLYYVNEQLKEILSIVSDKFAYTLSYPNPANIPAADRENLWKVACGYYAKPSIEVGRDIVVEIGAGKSKTLAFEQTLSGTYNISVTGLLDTLTISVGEASVKFDYIKDEETQTKTLTVSAADISSVTFSAGSLFSEKVTIKFVKTS